MRCLRSITEAGTISAVRSSAGASRAWKPMRTVRAAKRAAVTPADDPAAARRRRGALPRGEALDQPLDRPAECEAGAGEGEERVSMEPLSAANGRGTVGSAAMPDVDRDRRRGRRHDGRLGARGGGRRGDAARAGRARLRRDAGAARASSCRRTTPSSCPCGGRASRCTCALADAGASSASTATRRSGRCSWPGTRASSPRLAAAPVAGEHARRRRRRRGGAGPGAAGWPAVS